MRRGDSEHRLNKLQSWAQAAAISMDPRDRHETLRLLLQAPRDLCASTGHYPHLPSRETVHPPWPDSRDPVTTSLGERMACLRQLKCHTGLCCSRLAPHSIPLPPPGLSEPKPPNQLLFNPSCLGGNICPQATYMQSQGQIQS